MNDIEIFKALCVLVQREFGMGVLEDLLKSKNFHNIISEELYGALDWWLASYKANAEGYRAQEEHDMYTNKMSCNEGLDTLNKFFEITK